MLNKIKALISKLTRCMSPLIVNICDRYGHKAPGGDKTCCKTVENVSEDSHRSVGESHKAQVCEAPKLQISLTMHLLMNAFPLCL